MSKSKLDRAKETAELESIETETKHALHLVPETLNPTNRRKVEPQILAPLVALVEKENAEKAAANADRLKNESAEKPE
jgi:hypothetical protein